MRSRPSITNDTWPAANLDPKESINFRGTIARKYFRLLPLARQEYFEKLAKEMHEKERAKYEAELRVPTGPLVAEDIDQCVPLACSTFFY